MAFAAAWVYDCSGYWAPLYSASSPDAIPGHLELLERMEGKAAVSCKLPHPLVLTLNTDGESWTENE